MLESVISQNVMFEKLYNYLFKEEVCKVINFYIFFSFENSNFMYFQWAKIFILTTMIL